MPENYIERWYWILDEKTRRPILRGGRLHNTEHNEFFVKDLETDLVEELTDAFVKGEKPQIEFKVISLGRNREKIVITDVRRGRDDKK